MNRITLDVSARVAVVGPGSEFMVSDNYVFAGLGHCNGKPVTVWACGQNHTTIGIEPLTGEVIEPPAHWGNDYTVTTPPITLRLATLEVLLWRCERAPGWFRFHTDTGGSITIYPSHLPEVKTNELFAVAWLPVVTKLDGIVKAQTDKHGLCHSYGCFESGYYFLLRIDADQSALLYAEQATEMMAAVREILCFGSHHTRLGNFNQYTAHTLLSDMVVGQLGWVSAGNSRKSVVDKYGKQWHCEQTLDGSVRHISFMCSSAIELSETCVFTGNATLSLTVPLFDTKPVSSMLNAILDSITP